MATALVSSEGYACPACGGGVPEIGAVCLVCGSTLEIERCLIELWRGYTTASFIARTEDELVAESPSFRSRGRQAPAQSDATTEALSALTSELVLTGWSAAPDDGGDNWFDLAFLRLIAVPAIEVQESEVEPSEPVAPAPREVVHLVAEPAPMVVEARPVPVAPPPIAIAKPSRARGARIVSFVSLVGIVVAGGLGYVIAHRSPVVETRVLTVTQPAAPVAHTPVRQPAVVPQPAVTAKPVRVNLIATKDTWLELRQGSKTGRVVFSGILPQGQRLHASADRLWARFAAAGNVAVIVNGKPLQLAGTLERVFAASRS
jgi:hypothetical protein